MKSKYFLVDVDQAYILLKVETCLGDDSVMTTTTLLFFTTHFWVSYKRRNREAYSKLNENWTSFMNRNTCLMNVCILEYGTSIHYHQSRFSLTKWHFSLPILFITEELFLQSELSLIRAKERNILEKVVGKLNTSLSRHFCTCIVEYDEASASGWIVQ